jgi:hypothetical protein
MTLSGRYLILGVLILALAPAWTVPVGWLELRLFGLVGLIRTEGLDYPYEASEWFFRWYPGTYFPMHILMAWLIVMLCYWPLRVRYQWLAGLAKPISQTFVAVGVVGTGLLVGLSCGLCVDFPPLDPRVTCLVNLADLSNHLYTYASQHRGAVPPDFEALMPSDSSLALQLTNSLICQGLARRQAVPEGDLHSSYEYIPGQPLTGDPKNVLVYEKPGHHRHDGGYVLFQDGRVEWLEPYSRLLEAVSQTKQRLAGTESEAAASRSARF